MKKKTMIWIVVCVLMACCVYAHRRVIRALIKHEPMPKAPKWHVWCKDRKDRKKNKRKE